MPPKYGMSILFHQHCLTCTFVEYFTTRCIQNRCFPHTSTFLFSSAQINCSDTGWYIKQKGMDYFTIPIFGGRCMLPQCLYIVHLSLINYLFLCILSESLKTQGSKECNYASCFLMPLPGSSVHSSKLVSTPISCLIFSFVLQKGKNETRNKHHLKISFNPFSRLKQKEASPK